MTSLNRILALSGLTGLLGALAFAVPASANVKASCVIDGEVKAHTTKPVFKKYVQLIGGHGTYRFVDADVICLDMGKGKAPGTTHTGGVEATGTFKQEIILKSDPSRTRFPMPCGMGKATGVISSQQLGSKFRAIVGKKFAVQFGPAIDQGVFFWHHAGPPSKNVGGERKTFVSSREDEGPSKPGPKPYRYAGDMKLTQAAPQAKDPVEDLAKRGVSGTDDKCNKAFRVTGGVMVHETNPI